MKKELNMKEGKLVEVADHYLEDEASPKGATKYAIILQEPSDEEELVMIQYENRGIDYVPQDVINNLSQFLSLKIK